VRRKNGKEAAVLDVFLSQITDVFRIGLLVALVLTARRTVQATGTVLPLLAGIVFVAVIIPTTRGSTDLVQIGVGIVTNAALVAVVMLGVLAYSRLRG